MDFYNDIIFIDDKNSNDKGECIMDENQNQNLNQNNQGAQPIQAQFNQNVQNAQTAQNTNMNNANAYSQTIQPNAANTTSKKVKNSKSNKKDNVEKPKKKGKAGKIIAIIILIILVIAGGGLTGYLLTGGELNFFDNNETSSSSKSSKSKDSKKSNKDEDDNSKSEDKDSDDKEDSDEKYTGSKIDKNKPWVYDANYAEGKIEKTITTFEGTEYKTVDMLIAPYININSKAAKKANKEIKDVYNLSYEKYGETNESGAATLFKIEYEYIVKDKVLSIVVRQHNGVTNGGAGINFYTYNFNLDTYDEASLEDVFKACGFTSKEDLEDKIRITLENGVADGTVSSNSQWYNNQCYIDKNYNFNIINTEAPMGGNDSLVIKTDVVSNKKQKTSFELPEDDGYEPPAGPYGDGIEQIKSNLKDAYWIRNNVMMTKSCFGEAITGNQTLNFMKVIGGKYTPMFLVEAYSENDLSNQVFIVSYQGGRVVVKPFTKYPLHNSHAGVEVDPNKCIAVISYMHMGYFSETYYDLSSGRAKELIEIGGDDNNSSGTTYYKRAANSSETVSISKSEYDSIHAQYSNYKFYPIGTELNDANVNEYVK